MSQLGIQASVKNIYCVGRNYISFAEQMGNNLPSEPLIFLKPTHSLRLMDGSVLTISHDGEVNAEAELVFQVGTRYQPGMKAKDVLSKMTVGLDLTYRDILNAVKEQGKPWLKAKGFPNSSAIGTWLPFDGKRLSRTAFQLKQKGELRQQGEIARKIFPIQTVIDFLGVNYGLGEGDLIYTGTPKGIVTLSDGDELEVLLGGESLGTSRVNLKRSLQKETR